MSKIQDALEKADNLRQLRPAEVREPEPVAAAPSRLPAREPGLEAAASSRERRGSGYLRLGAGLCLLLLAGLGGYHYAENIPAQVRPAPRAAELPGTPQRDPRRPVVAKPFAQPHRLPSCIPLNAPNAGYASAHPGWQSYQTRAQEFRVFRRGGAVQAIQVFSLRGGGITGEFFGAFLGEVAGKEPLRVSSREEEGGYLVERGVLGAAAQLTVYRKKASGEIRAFVVAYR